MIAVSGWRVKGALPRANKFIVIGAPHTSNWDLILLLAAAYSLHLSVNWLGKDSLFKGVLGPLLRFLGGIPVDRSRNTDFVAKLVDDIHGRSQCAIVVSPEGTRSRTEFWKSGFYWLARGANIPIVCGYLDYRKKEAGIGYSFIPTRSVSDDMDQLRAFYADIVARRPGEKSPVRLRDEQC